MKNILHKSNPGNIFNLKAISNIIVYWTWYDFFSLFSNDYVSQIGMEIRSACSDQKIKIWRSPVSLTFFIFDCNFVQSNYLHSLKFNNCEILDGNCDFVAYRKRFSRKLFVIISCIGQQILFINPKPLSRLRFHWIFCYPPAYSIQGNFH